MAFKIDSNTTNMCVVKDIFIIVLKVYVISLKTTANGERFITVGGRDFKTAVATHYYIVVF
jgi:hypothetical protein